MGDHSTGSASLCPDGRYTRLPDAVLPLLTPREHQLVHALLSYRWTAESTIRPSVRTLARQCGCSGRTVQRTLRRLEDRGYLVTVARYRDDAGQTSNEYRPGPLLTPLLPPAPVRSDAPVGQGWRPPMTRPSVERELRNQTYRTRRTESGRYIRPARSSADLLMSRYGPVEQSRR